MLKCKYPKNYFITRQSLQKIPDHLILKRTTKYSSGLNEDCFAVVSTKNPKEKAVMYCNPESVYRKDMGRVNSLYISYLDTLGSPNKGMGTILLNFAQRYSKEIGCEGRLHLDASKLNHSERVPHVFYKKYGMNTGNIKIDAKLDLYVRKGQDATELEFPTMSMFYPPIDYNVKDKTPFFKRVLDSIIQYFKLNNTIKV